MSILYIVPTPIGNMEDITLRARRVLSEVDFVACEDSRVGGKLMLLLGLKKPLYAYHEHNKQRAGEVIAERIAAGEDCALITDAGTPAVSDPGEDLVRLCRSRGIEVVPLPGACAAVTALSASGLPSRRFCFEGFRPEDGLKEYLEPLSREKRTMIFYSAPHDLIKTLKTLYDAFGDRNAALCKELTKLNERITQKKLSEHIADCESAESIRGEYVVVVEGYTHRDEDEFWYGMTPEQHVEHYRALGLSDMDAIKQTARDRGVPKGAIYGLIKKG